MRVLIGYASAHGSTKEIAKAIGDRLTQSGLQADVRSVGEIADVAGYDAAVIGSAIHDMAWLPAAAAFMRQYGADLAKRPVWLFSVSSIGDTSSFFGPRVARFMRRRRKETKEIAGFREAIRPREHRNFAGVIEGTHWNFVGNLFLKALGGSLGDHRDWRDIDAWAEEVARQLLAAKRAIDPQGMHGSERVAS